MENHEHEANNEKKEAQNKKKTIEFNMAAISKRVVPELP